MKSGVQSISIKLLDPETTESLNEILDNPEAFHGIDIKDDEEIMVQDRKYAILELEGKGEIGPWTRIILKFDASETPVDMLIVLDTSYSMITTFEDTTRFDLAVNCIVSLLGIKAKKLIAGIMAYGIDWEMTLDMTNVKSLTKKKLKGIENELKKIKHKGKAAAGTALNGALEVFTVKGLNDIRAVVLITDGTDEIGPNPLKEGEELVSRGIYIYPFYLGEEKDQKSLTILKRIASMSYTELFTLYNAVEEEKRRLIRASLKTTDEEEKEGEKPIEGEKPHEGTGTDEVEKLDERDKPEEGERPGEGAEPTEGYEEKISGEDKEEQDVPSGSELFKRVMSELGTSLPMVIQQGGKKFEPEEDGEVQVIKAGVPLVNKDQEESGEPTFKRTPRIIEAIKHFIEWLKSLIW